jgi:hypothetical protein
MSPANVSRPRTIQGRRHTGTNAVRRDEGDRSSTSARVARAEVSQTGSAGSPRTTSIRDSHRECVRKTLDRGDPDGDARRTQSLHVNPTVLLQVGEHDIRAQRHYRGDIRVLGSADPGGGEVRRMSAPVGNPTSKCGTVTAMASVKTAQAIRCAELASAKILGCPDYRALSPCADDPLQTVDHDGLGR